MQTGPTVRPIAQDKWLGLDHSNVLLDYEKCSVSVLIMAVIVIMVIIVMSGVTAAISQMFKNVVYMFDVFRRDVRPLERFTNKTFLMVGVSQYQPNWRNLFQIL